MTITYDPQHPQYLDEADVRDETDPGVRRVPRLPAVRRVLHVVPDAVRDDRPSRRSRRRAAHAGPAGPGRRRVLPVQALLRQLPVHPRAARVGDRLSPADAARRRDAPRHRPEPASREPAHRHASWAAPTCSAGVGARWRHRSPTRWSAPSQARVVRKAIAGATGVSSVRLLPPYARQRFTTWFKRAPAGSHRPAPRAGHRVPHVPRRVPGSRRSATTS